MDHWLQTHGCLQASRWGDCGRQADSRHCGLMGTSVSWRARASAGASSLYSQLGSSSCWNSGLVFPDLMIFQKKPKIWNFMWNLPIIKLAYFFLNTKRFFFNLEAKYSTQTAKLQLLCIIIIISSKRNLFSTFVTCS